MSDRMAARIFIGGRIPEILVEPLCDQIRGVASLEYGCEPFEPRTAEDLMAALEDQGDNLHLLVLYDAEASWGEFQELEEFLRDHEIAYTRHSDGKYEYDPCIVEYRPGRDLVELDANKNLAPIILVSDAQKVLDQLDEAAKHDHNRRTGAAEAALMKARRMLRGLLPPELPSLASFEIAGVDSKGTANEEVADGG